MSIIDAVYNLCFWFLHLQWWWMIVIPIVLALPQICKTIKETPISDKIEMDKKIYRVFPKEDGDQFIKDWLQHKKANIEKK